mgnify:FL=1
MTRATPHPAVLWPLALVVGAGVFGLSCLTEEAQRRTLNFGTEYAQMATEPFALLGKYPHRILGPLVAHALGLDGERYWMFAHGCAVALLALVFATAARFGAGLAGAALLTLVIGFTGTVQIFKGHTGYPDTITFLLLTATILAYRRPAPFWALQLLNALNHEQVLFFWPWLLWWRRRDPNARWRDDAIGATAVLAIYVAWRLYVGARAETQLLTMEHYLGLGYFPVGTLGLAALNVLSTFIWFGLLPIWVAWHAFADGWRRAGAGIVLFLICLHAVFGVAHDVYRFTCFLFVPVLFAGVRLLERPRGALVVGLTGAASAVVIVLQAPVFERIGVAVLVEQTENGPAVRPDPVMSIVPDVIPAYPVTFAVYGLCVVATVVIGWAWARASREAAA